MSDALSRDIDALIEQGLSRKVFPSAGVIVLRKGKVVYRKAFNSRLDSVYDLASLTKAIATAPSVLALVEAGKLSISDTLQKLRPEVRGPGTAAITIESLLRHRSGYPADNPMSEYSGPISQVQANLDRVATIARPSSKFLYSDVGYIHLGRVVEALSGKSLSQFTDDAIFGPLGMLHTGFRPLPTSTPCELCVPTSKNGLPGRVHDGRSIALNGVSGHAGVFSTLDDLALFSQMVLDCGRGPDGNVLSRSTVRAMTQILPELSAGEIRGLGWDIDTPYSAPRGNEFPIGSFGHTGFTGTSIWIDPSSQTAVIFLSNRVYYENFNSNWGKSKDLVELRRALSSTVARSIIAEPKPDASAIAKFCR